MTTKAVGEISKDLGNTHVDETKTPHGPLLPDKQFVLQQVKDVIGNKQVIHKSLEFAAPWLVRESFETELNENWSEAFDESKNPT